MTVPVPIQHEITKQVADRLLKTFVASRAGLLLDDPPFGAPSCRLQTVIDPSCNTGWTDGVHIAFNPDWFDSLDWDQKKCFIAHEALHCMCGHFWRRDGRDPWRWNIAGDHSINNMLVENKYKLPPGGLCDPQFKGMSAEAIYPHIPEQPPGVGKDGKDGSDPGGCGEVRDTPDPQKKEEIKAEWEQAVLQADAMAKAQGNMPAGLDRLINEIKKPECHDLISALSQFVARSAREDYSYRLPNKRYIAQGLYLPSLYSESLAPICIGVDTSGSISNELLSRFVGAVQVVLDESKPERVTVYSCDAQVHKEAQYEPGDFISTEPKDYPGGGGSSSIPVFQKIDELNEEIACAIYITDGYLSVPDTAPDYPVLWVIMDKFGVRNSLPFGETIWLNG